MEVLKQRVVGKRNGYNYRDCLHTVNDMHDFNESVLFHHVRVKKGLHGNLKKGT